MRITALMFVTMVIAALIVNGIFSALGLLPPDRDRPAPTSSRAIQVDYKLALNLLGVAIFAALFWLTVQRGATDPVCGMKVDRAKAVTKEFGGRTYYFCSNHCRHAFEADPDKYLSGNAPHPPITGTPPMPTTEPNTRGIAMTERGSSFMRRSTSRSPNSST